MATDPVITEPTTDPITPVVAPVVAPVVEPVVEPVITPVVEPVVDPVVEPTGERPLDTETWGTTGDTAGDSVMTLLQNADVSVDDAKSLMFDAVQSGDVSKIDKAALIEKVGATKAELVLAGVENYLRRATDKAASLLADVHTAVGGKENWTSVAAWAKANVAADALGEYKTLIDAGGAQARFAAGELLSLYNAAETNTTISLTSSITPDASAAPNVRASTRAEYVKELQAAHKDPKSTPATFAAIQAARERGRKQNL